MADLSMVQCPDCQAMLPVPTERLGRKVRCGAQINGAIPGDIVHSFFNNAGDLIPKKAER
jgi:hypothetical protein